MGRCEKKAFDAGVGARMRQRRLAIGMSQTRLGEALGVTFQQIQKYERGTNRIGAGQLQLIARALNVSAGYFYEDDEDDTESSEIVLSTRQSAELQKQFLRLANPTLRQHVLALVKAMVEAQETDRTVEKTAE